MTYTRLSETVANLGTRTIKSSRFIALAIVAAFTSIALQPAQAQSSDTWKSVAIIGGSTVAGAYIGHKVAGSTGAMVGAGLGASVGYSVDRRRRANEYNNQYAYGDGGYYGNSGSYYGNGNDGGYYGNNGGYYGNGNNGGYYGNDGGYYGNGGYNGPYDGSTYPYPSGYQANNYRSHKGLVNRR
ncbi:MAG: hypothetical protein ACJ71Q_06325 [Terriglobales bacterium]